MARRRQPGESLLNKEIAQRIRVSRLSMSPPMSQEKLAEALGISFQMVQKYENGTSYISAAKLILAGRALNIPPAFLLEGFPD